MWHYNWYLCMLRSSRIWIMTNCKITFNLFEVQVLIWKNLFTSLFSVLWWSIHLQIKHLVIQIFVRDSFQNGKVFQLQTHFFLLFHVSTLLYTAWMIVLNLFLDVKYSFSSLKRKRYFFRYITLFLEFSRFWIVIRYLRYRYITNPLITSIKRYTTFTTLL